MLNAIPEIGIQRSEISIYMRMRYNISYFLFFAICLIHIRNASNGFAIEKPSDTHTNTQPLPISFRPIAISFHSLYNLLNTLNVFRV